jgi:hypothetical protein
MNWNGMECSPSAGNPPIVVSRRLDRRGLAQDRKLCANDRESGNVLHIFDFTNFFLRAAPVQKTRKCLVAKYWAK